MILESKERVSKFVNVYNLSKISLKNNENFFMLDKKG